MVWYYVLEIGNYPCLIMANSIGRSQYLGRERILDHLKTIFVVPCGGEGTPMAMKYSRARSLEKEIALLITIGPIFAVSSY